MPLLAIKKVKPLDRLLDDLGLLWGINKAKSEKRTEPVYHVSALRTGATQRVILLELACI